MKSKKTELDVDFIGGQEPLTKDEEKAISEYLKSAKQKNVKILGKSKKASSRPHKQYA